MSPRQITTKELAAKVDTLTDRVDKIVESAPAEPANGVMRWVHHNPWVLSIVIVLLVAVPGYLRMQAITDETAREVDTTQDLLKGRDAFLKCMQKWGDSMTARNAAQDEVIGKRIDHITKAFGAAMKHDNKAIVRETTAMKSDYDKRKDDAPTPKLRC